MNIENSDKIHIRDLKLRTVIGVNPEERNIRQDLIFNLTIYTNQKPAAEDDDFLKTVDYDGATRSVASLVEESSFELIEALAAAVADHLLKIRGVIACRVVLDKPGVVSGCRSVAVDIFRKNS